MDRIQQATKDILVSSEDEIELPDAQVLLGKGTQTQESTPFIHNDDAVHYCTCATPTSTTAAAHEYTAKTVGFTDVSVYCAGLSGLEYPRKQVQ